LTTATASTGDADGRAGRGRHPEIAHADIGALLELVEVGNKGVGLDDVGPGGARRLETPVEVLECLLHLRRHVAFADAVAVGVAGQLAGGVDDLATAAHGHDVRVGRLSARHSDIHAFRLKPLDLKNRLALLVNFVHQCARHWCTRRPGGLAVRFRQCTTMVCEARRPIAAERPAK
jgi:hypothetical protein